MRAQTLEDLIIWQRARELNEAVSAILRVPPLCGDVALARQLGSAAASVLANIAEGFAQRSDRAFANYLFIARRRQRLAAPLARTSQ
jgi:four helix bundle protein